MTSLDLIALTPFLLEHDDLLRPPLLGYFCHDLGRFEYWSTDLDIIAIDDHQDLAQVDDVSDIPIQFLDTQLISTGNLILFPAGSYYCIH